jgi:hypothetical protein
MLSHTYPPASTMPSGSTDVYCHEWPKDHASTPQRGGTAAKRSSLGAVPHLEIASYGMVWTCGMHCIALLCIHRCAQQGFLGETAQWQSLAANGVRLADVGGPAESTDEPTRLFTVRLKHTRAAEGHSTAAPATGASRCARLPNSRRRAGLWPPGPQPG